MNFIKTISKKISSNNCSQEQRQVLLLELTETEIRMDIYQHRELSSRSVKLQADMNEHGLDAYFDELVRVLRSELLWRLEDTAELVFFLPEEWCYTDRLEMPPLDKRELERALEWELEQYVPWPRNNYYYDLCLTPDENGAYLVAAAPHRLIDRIIQAGRELDVTVTAITTSISADGYLAGKLYPNLLPAKYKRRLRFKQDKPLAEFILMLAVVLSLAMIGTAFAWRYWNEDNVDRLKGELKSLAEWEERMDWTDNAQRRIKHLQKILGALDKDKQSVLPQLELWETTIGDGCWLERIETVKNDRELVLYGRGRDSAGVTAFVDKLKDSGLYKKVDLTEIQSNDNDTYVGFTVHLMLKEGAK